MSIAISDALQQAESAIQGGDHRAAIQTCNKLVSQFPDYVAAYRVLGEAYLGQGRVTEAEQAFAQVLTRDPRQPVAYHGLGLIAERQDVLENALAFCQVAWELAPNQPKLREPVIRIASRRYGSEGQAQLTSAALAQIYANTARHQRAAGEYRGALAELPDRVDLKLGLAETLWKLGRDDEAATLSREVLEEHPAAIQALVVLADIENRQGNDAEAGQLRARIRAIDPDGAIAATMLAGNERANREALLLDGDAVPLFEEQVEATTVERPRIAPAPDFTYQPARAETAVQDIADLEPISAEEFGGEPVAEEVAPEALVSDSVDDPFAALQTDVEDDPFAAFETELSHLSPVDEAAPEASTISDPLAIEADDLEGLLADFGDVEPMGLDEFGAEPGDLERLAAAEHELFADDDFFGGLTSSEETATGENEHVRSLASALEADVAEVLDRTGQLPAITPEMLADSDTDADSEVVDEVATPDPLSGTGFTSVLRELGDEGYAPFDPLGRQDVRDSADATSLEAESDSFGASDDNELLKLTADWESIDDEISRAMPATTGNTDALLASDDLNIEPFNFELEDDTSRLPAYRPFGEDDDELPEITVAAEDVVETPEAQATIETTPDVTSGDETFDDLEPFSMEEFEDAGPGQQFSFGRLPWETADGDDDATASDDLESLLTPEDLAPGDATATSDWPTQVLDTTSPATDDEDDWNLISSEIIEPDSIQTDRMPDWIASIQDDVADEIDDSPITPPVEPAPEWNVPDDWDASLAVTRQIAGEPENPLTQLTGDEVPLHDVDLGETAPEALAADRDIFERARVAKTDLIGQGAIEGDRDLPAAEAEATPEEPTPEAEVQEEDADDFVVTTSATRDVATLRASLEAAPNDDELRWWLAEALRERGDVDDAYGEYRWIIRNAPHRADDVVEAINACVGDDQHAEVGHRLLADIYRRRGQVSLASSHAAAAMSVRRRLRG